MYLYTSTLHIIMKVSVGKAKEIMEHFLNAQICVVTDVWTVQKKKKSQLGRFSFFKREKISTATDNFLMLK